MISAKIHRVLRHILLGLWLAEARAGTGLYTGPYFPQPQPKNVTVHQNTVAYLPCAVKQLGDKSVSWVRQRDADILTVDRYTFVRDERLTVHYIPDTQTWTLVIKYVQERDGGTYECQISTEPKMSLLVNLNVIVPKVEVVGAIDKYVRKGSTAKLECTVSSTVQLPDYIFWYRSGQRLLEYDHPRIQISFQKHGKPGGEMSVTSALVITKAMESDDGNYTCLPSNLNGATTVLHVLTDEHPAAMQTGAAMLTNPPSPCGVFIVVLLVFFLGNAHQEIPVSFQGKTKLGLQKEVSEKEDLQVPRLSKNRQTKPKNPSKSPCKIQDKGHHLSQERRGLSRHFTGRKALGVFQSEGLLLPDREGASISRGLERLSTLKLSLDFFLPLLLVLQELHLGVVSTSIKASNIMTLENDKGTRNRLVLGENYKRNLGMIGGQSYRQSLAQYHGRNIL